MYKCGKLSEQEKFLPNNFKFTGMRSWDEADETVRQVCLFVCLSVRYLDFIQVQSLIILIEGSSMIELKHGVFLASC